MTSSVTNSTAAEVLINHVCFSTGMVY
jgi:hypothetical protein